MTRTPIRSRTIAALGGFAVRASVVGGFALGALAGAQGRPPEASCADGELCVGEQIATTLLAVLGPALAGALLGLAVAFLFVLLLNRFGLRRAIFRAPAAQWIVTRYSGYCWCCAAAVSAGERVLHDRASRTITCGGCAGS